MQNVAIMGCTVLCQDGMMGAVLACFTGEAMGDKPAAVPFSSWPGEQWSKGCVRVVSGILSLL